MNSYWGHAACVVELPYFYGGTLFVSLKGQRVEQSQQHGVLVQGSGYVGRWAPNPGPKDWSPSERKCPFPILCDIDDGWYEVVISYTPGGILFGSLGRYMVSKTLQGSPGEKLYFVP